MILSPVAFIESISEALKLLKEGKSLLDRKKWENGSSVLYYVLKRERAGEKTYAIAQTSSKDAFELIQEMKVFKFSAVNDNLEFDAIPRDSDFSTGIVKLEVLTSKDSPASDARPGREYELV